MTVHVFLLAIVGLGIKMDPGNKKLMELIKENLSNCKLPFNSLKKNV